jgi:hypothetical protein
MIFTTRPQRLETENRSLWSLRPWCGILSSPLRPPGLVIRRGIASELVRAKHWIRSFVSFVSFCKISVFVSFVSFCVDPVS